MSENIFEWYTDDELDEKLIAIEKSCRFYKKYKDGSYHQALDGAGYTKVLAEIKRRKELNND